MVTPEQIEIAECLKQVILDLDSAIASVVGNPLTFQERPLVQAIETHCAQISAFTKLASVSEETETLVWEVRTRAGRFQRLWDAASALYSTCFSLQPSEGLAYGVHGEWREMTTSTHLTVDC